MKLFPMMLSFDDRVSGECMGKAVPGPSGRLGTGQGESVSPDRQLIQGPIPPLQSIQRNYKTIAPKSATDAPPLLVLCTAVTPAHCCPPPANCSTLPYKYPEILFSSAPLRLHLLHLLNNLTVTSVNSFKQSSCLPSRRMYLTIAPIALIRTT